MSEKSDKKIVKATMEAVFNSQERIRKHLETLIKENRCLKDESERDLFYRELTYSTLGLGTEVEFYLKIMPNSFPEYMGSVEERARILARATKNVFIFDKSKGMEYDPVKFKAYSRIEIPISKFWEITLHRLFEVFPLALERAMSLSREQEESQKTMGYMVEKK